MAFGRRAVMNLLYEAEIAPQERKFVSTLPEIAS